ncbi:unnamed protein product [Vicia faba]|uniref:Uncharacterized protein n=1 Tax=Vicia faba TaxID=3906 RepID=A0AAV1AMQ9_VICFA|nr:unnamed protein product [Vicia faba]
MNPPTMLLRHPVMVTPTSSMISSIKLTSSFLKRFRTPTNAFPVGFLHFIFNARKFEVLVEIRFMFYNIDRDLYVRYCPVIFSYMVFEVEFASLEQVHVSYFHLVFNIVGYIVI